LRAVFAGPSGTALALLAGQLAGVVPGLPADLVQGTARSMRASGDYDVSSIAKVLGVSRASVYRALGLPTLEPGGSQSEPEAESA